MNRLTFAAAIFCFFLPGVAFAEIVEGGVVAEFEAQDEQGEVDHGAARFVAFSQWRGGDGEEPGVLAFTASVGEVQTRPENYDSAVEASQKHLLPWYTSLGLSDNQVRLEMVERGRAAVYRMTFPESKKCHALIDVSYPMDRFEGGEIRLHDSKTIEGYGDYLFGGEVVRVYFTFRFSKPFRERSAWDGTGVLDRGVGRAESREALGAYVYFWNREGETVLMKRGLSTESLEDARAGVFGEFPGWDFNGLLRETAAGWSIYLMWPIGWICAAG